MKYQFWFFFYNIAPNFAQILPKISYFFFCWFPMKFAGDSININNLCCNLVVLKKVGKTLALLHFRTPLFLLMILVQNFMLIKNHIETWVWKSTETKLFTSKVLQNLEVTMKKRHGFNTTILSPSWKIDKLKNNITKITQQ